MFYFTPLFGVLFTFPSRYWFTIGHTVVFSLISWSRLIHMGFHVSHATRDSATILKFSTTGLSPSLVQYLAASSNRQIRVLLSHYPNKHARWFRLFPVRSPLLGESLIDFFSSSY